MRRSTTLFFLAGLLLVMGCSSAPSAKGPAESDVGKSYVCPECGKEFPYQPVFKNMPCPACSKPNIRLVETYRGETPMPPWQKWLAIGVFLAVGAQGTLYLWMLRKRTYTARVKEKPPELKCRCPYCKRKYKYLASRAGQGVVCRNCKTAFVFPDASEAEQAE